MSRDLFTRVIMQSASPLSPWGLITVKEAKRRSMVLAKKLGCPVDDGGVGASKDTLKVEKCFKTSNGQFSFLIFSITLLTSAYQHQRNRFSFIYSILFAEWVDGLYDRKISKFWQTLLHQQNYTRFSLLKQHLCISFSFIYQLLLLLWEIISSLQLPRFPRLTALGGFKSNYLFYAVIMRGFSLHKLDPWRKVHLFSLFRNGWTGKSNLYRRRNGNGAEIKLFWHSPPGHDYLEVFFYFSLMFSICFLTKQLYKSVKLLVEY